MKKTIGTTILATTLALGLFATEANVANDELTAESTNTEVSQYLENMEKNMETTKKQNLFEIIGQFFANAFSDMKESAKAQHELDKANFEAVKAESKANFEENKFHNSLARAKEQSKKSWEDAKMSPSERTKQMQDEREAKLKEAQERKAAAEKRYEKAKKN
ncbi:MAG: hypothetical protein J6C25_12180 [Treponema sp.]|nr:hypothetical protein [Treponema sp.]